MNEWMNGQTRVNVYIGEWVQESERMRICYVDTKEANGDQEEKGKRKNSSERDRKKGDRNENESKNYGNGIME